MLNIKVTYNVKPKETQEMEVENYQDLIQKIYAIFNIEEGKINFMKPRIKVLFLWLRIKNLFLKK